MSIFVVMEQWKPIPNFSKYHASDTGFIKTFNWKNKGTTSIMKPAKDHKGYLRTMLLGDDGNFHTIKLHRIIAQTFIDNPNDLATVNHKDGVKSNNHVDNLEWASVQDNNKHRDLLGLQKIKRGSEISTAKVSEEQVLEIRAKFKPRAYTRKMLAEEYGLKVSGIKSILARHCWKHV